MRQMLKIGAAVLALLGAAPALAQKSADTVRVGCFDPVASALLYDDSQPEIGLLSRAVFDPLICFDARAGGFKPLLATSWTTPDSRTIDFELRRDVKFHDGSGFSADDVVYTLRYVTAADTNFRFKENFDWLASIEKLDDYRVRTKLKRPVSNALMRLAISFAVLPAAKHGPLADKAEFGRRIAIGTGPFRLESLDASKGVVLVRNPAYPQGSDCKPAAKVGRIHAIPMPELQTQVAQLATGGLDLLHVASKDVVDFVGADPRSAVTASQSITYHYMAIDSVGRSGHPALKDIRVRQALMQSIDRALIIRNVVPGGEAVTPHDALCFRIQLGCDFSTKPPAYDREAAKALMTQAGYADGFDIEITATPGSHDLGVAIAGELRKINVRAKVDKVTFVAYRQKQRDSKLQLLIGQWTSGGVPDASSPAEFFFDRGARDYWRDPQIDAWVQEGLAADDEAVRKQAFGRVFDRANEQRYILPISTKPDVFVHTKDLTVARGSMSVYGADANELAWK